MNCFDGETVLPAAFRGGAIALGNFDGFHLGHQAVVARAVSWAREHQTRALVGTFDPHPARLFTPDLEPIALTSMAQRLALFAAIGVDAAVIWRFDRALAAVPAEAFLAGQLAARIAPRHVVTGWDFSFGARRGGSAAMLARHGADHGFTAQEIAPVMLDGQIVSSTRVREALRAGDPRGATRLMGRPFAISGVVEHGAKLGRTLGFPTANLRLGEYLRPAYGVYAVRVVLADGRRLDGVANLGIRPMFDPPVELLESYIFDFAGDLYGQTIAVELIDYLRPEWKLDGLDALMTQVEADKVAAREALGVRSGVQ